MLLSQAAKFNNISSLQVHCRGNAGLDESDDAVPVRIFWVGLRGDVTGFRHGIVNAVYESRPQLSDHSLPNDLKGFASTGL